MTIANYHAEQALLAYAIRNPTQYKILSDIVQPQSFGWECFSWAWDAMGRLTERGLTIDGLTVGDELARDGHLDGFQLPSLKQFSGRAAISQLRDIETTDAGESYAIEVQDYAAKRQLDLWLTTAHNHAHNGRNASAIMADLQASFDSLVLHSGKIITHTTTATQFADAGVELSKLASKGGRVITTGIPELDRLIFPIRGELITVAAGPGKGKSSLLTTIALNAAQVGKKIKLFTLEMGNAQVAQRLLSQLSGLDGSHIMKGQLSTEGWEKLKEARDELAILPIQICDLPAIKIGQIRTEARRSPADIIMVDYVQLANADIPNKNRVLEIGEITRGLKALAGELDVVIYAAAQINRAADARSDKKPILSDLRESGSIEQDSDTVVFIHPDAIKLTNVELIAAKHRNGATGVINAHFDPPTTRFTDDTARAAEAWQEQTR